MLSHATARDWLIPYTDGMLSADERQRVDGHVASCASCGREVDALRELNLILVSLPAAPPLAYAPFWLKLQAALPAPRRSRLPVAPRYRRASFAFAAAAFAVLAAAGSAFAAESALPDSPLYPLKQAEESMQLTLASASDKLKVEVRIGSERLREAQVMAATGKPALADKSVRAFRLLVPAITAGLANTLDARAAKETRARLDLELTAVEEANATRGDDDAELKQLVLTSLKELDVDVKESQPLVVTTPAAETTPPPVHATPKPTPRPTPRPEPTPGDDGRQQHE